MPRLRQTVYKREDVIKVLRRELHLHRHTNGWYHTISRTEMCFDKESCIYVERKLGEMVDTV